MGLITGLLTLPLAPVRGTVWIAEQVQKAAENEAYDESEIRSALIELDEARASGQFDEAEITEAEDVLIERLMALRAMRGEGPGGGI